MLFDSGCIGLHFAKVSPFQLVVETDGPRAHRMPMMMTHGDVARLHSFRGAVVSHLWSIGSKVTAFWGRFVRFKCGARERPHSSATCS